MTGMKTASKKSAKKKEVVQQKVKPKFHKNGNGNVKFAYMMSRFPKISETFVLYEILALMDHGISVKVYPLMKEKPDVVHGGVARVMPFVHYLPFVSAAILWSNLYFFLRKPVTYSGMIVELIVGAVQSPKYFSKTLALFPKMVRIAHKMKKQDITHIHAHFATFPAYAAMTIRKLTGIPYSFTAHGSDIHVHIHRYRLRDKVVNCDFVRSISAYNKEFIIDNVGEDVRDKIKVIHCGIDPKVFSAPEKRKDDGVFKIVCVASYEIVKGHTYLIEACKKLHQDSIKFHLHLVGDGQIRQQVTAEIQNAGIADHVTIHGALQREKVAHLLKNSDVKVLPSILTERGDREGIPVAIMEAMAVELPVVSSDLSGIPELVANDKTGILVEPRDANGIYKAFKKLQANPELRNKMGEAGREKVFSEFNLNENSEILLQELIDSHKH